MSDLIDIFQKKRNLFEAVALQGTQQDKNLRLQDVLNFIGAHLGELALDFALPLLHNGLKAHTKQQEAAKYDIGKYFLELIVKHHKQDKEFRLILQLIYQTLVTLSASEELREQLHIGHEVANELIAVLFESKDMKLNAILLSCLEMHIKVYEAKDMIMYMWSSLKQQTTKEGSLMYAGQILCQLFNAFASYIDNFHRSGDLTAITERLLVSEVREERKISYYLLRRVVEVLVSHREISPFEMDTTSKLNWFWSTYITILENLEENQSHLILPSLASLTQLRDANLSFTKWVDILYQKILNHRNILVVRFIVEFMLSSYQCSQLSVNVLRALLQSVNNNSLYNYENYVLPSDHLANFFNCDCLEFIIGMAEVNWRSVPLHFWLNALDENGVGAKCRAIPKGTLFGIAGRIRALQNRYIRVYAVHKFIACFKKNIAELPLNDFVLLVESLYNTSDKFFEWDLLMSKIESTDLSKGGVKFSHTFYQIVRKTADLSLVLQLIDVLKTQPKERHGSLRFFFVHFFKQHASLKEFTLSHYHLDLNTMTKWSNFQDISNVFDLQFCWEKSEKCFVYELAKDYVVSTRNVFHDLYHNEDILLLLEDTNVERFQKLLKDLAEHAKVVDASVIDAIERAFLSLYKDNIDIRFSFAYYVQYLKKTHSTAEVKQSICNVLECHIEFLGEILREDFGICLPAKYYEGALLYGAVNTGDARIEDCYLNSFMVDYSARHLRVENIERIPQQMQQELIEVLFDRNDELSMKKPRHYENSMEHRLKMRIANALFRLLSHSTDRARWLSRMWRILLDQINHLNVVHVYEMLIAVCSPNDEEICQKLENIQQFTLSRQLSIVTVFHTYAVWKGNGEGVDRLIPLTMGANFQLRLYAQLMVLNLYNKFGLKRLEIIAESIKKTIGDDWNEFSEDIRLKLPDMIYFDPWCTSDIVFYITNAPYDEYYVNNGVRREYEETKKLYKKKLRNLAKHSAADERAEQAQSNAENVAVVQRKMNPLNGILPQSTLVSYPHFKDNQMYVVASLVDKLPNLGGIARTCEVLGIQNLVLSSKAHADKADFKNISMTAENSLNILEIPVEALGDFLMRKQGEGFEIVGAEQTANSEQFENFKFPKKCVLLLGHEKEGIPPNLLGFLDYAVEIPQFGVVRSLNVHVTAALFMWEYCRQHMISHEP